MFWNKLLRRDMGRLEMPGATASGDEVGDELMFHFRKLVDEKLAEGRSFDSAWESAEEQFGPMRRYEYECRSGQIAQRFKWCRLTALAALALAVSFLAGWPVLESRWQWERGEVRLLREEVALLRQEQAGRDAEAGRGGPARRIAGGFDLRGTVVDDNGRPLEHAIVLIIRKTWPGGGYRQEAFTASTDDEGRFSLPEFVPADDRYGIQVAALKEGFAFQSVYQLKVNEPIEKPDPIALRLERASQVTLIVRDGNGQPIPNAGVFPSARRSRDGEDFMIYFHGSEPVHTTTDDAGRVCLNCFLAGDRAEIYLRVPGEDWNNREFEVSAGNQVVELAASNTHDE